MIAAQIASLTEREESLMQTVYSLVNQVDLIFVALNNYKRVPEFLFHPKISCEIMNNSTGDAAKFYGVELMDCFLFTCDDDLIYPDTYVKDMLRKLKEYNNSIIVTLHGVRFDSPQIKSYYKDISAVKYRCLDAVKEDTFVDVGGTGVMAFHTSCIDLKYSDFEAPNMADVWLAKIAKQQGVRILVKKHPKGYLDYIHPTWNIYDQQFRNCDLQTDITNKFIL